MGLIWENDKFETNRLQPGSVYVPLHKKFHSVLQRVGSKTHTRKPDCRKNADITGKYLNKAALNIFC